MKRFQKSLLAGIFVLGISALKVFAAAPNTYNIYIATTQAIVSGSGTLFSIGISSGNPGDYVVCYDTYSLTGNFATTQGTTAFPELARIFVSSVNSSANGPVTGYPPPNFPILNFSIGLTCAQSAAQRAFIWYRQPN